MVITPDFQSGDESSILSICSLIKLVYEQPLRCDALITIYNWICRSRRGLVKAGIQRTEFESLLSTI